MNLCGFNVGNDQPLFLIAGTCVVESEQMSLDTAGALKEMTSELGIPFIYKSSFDKANRSSSGSFRGPGMEAGLRILGEVRKQLDVPVLTDVHEDTPMDEVADVVDVIQTPASSAVRRISFCGPRGPVSRSISRKASSCRPGKCRTLSTRRSRPATKRSW